MADDVKRLYRSKSDRWLFGVCGGIGEYFNLDPTLVRVAFVLLALIVGGGLLIYIILIIIIPLEPDHSPPPAEVLAPEEDPDA